MEELKSADLILSQQLFADAPQSLRQRIDQALRALQKGSKGEALNELRQVDKLVKQEGLVEYEAEMYAAWAVYYFYMKEERAMYQAIRKAQRREPDNQRIGELRDILKPSS